MKWGELTCRIPAMCRRPVVAVSLARWITRLAACACLAVAEILTKALDRSRATTDVELKDVGEITRHDDRHAKTINGGLALT